MKNIKIDTTAFITHPDRGFVARAYHLKEPAGDALVEIYRDEKPYRRFLYPAYKIWNIAAHFSDIVTSEIEGNGYGYDLAGWTGFNVIPPIDLPFTQTEEYHCDFCHAPGPTRMYANPPMYSTIADVQFDQGHFGACDRCGDALEAGAVDTLLELNRKKYPSLPEAIWTDLRKMYLMISRTREPFEAPEEYKRKRGL